MESIITVKNLSFNYGNKLIFDNFNLNIKQGTFTTVIGPIGSGKSTLMKLLTGHLKGQGDIIVNGYNNLKKIKQNIGIIFQTNDNQITSETVMSEIAFALESFNYEPDVIQGKVLEVSKLLGIDNLLNEDPNNLSNDNKLLVVVAKALVLDPPIIILDLGLYKYDNLQKGKILTVIKNIHNMKKVTVIHVTNDIEDVLFGDEIIMINEGKLVLQGKTNEVLSESEVFNKFHIERPFIVELSEKLKFYGVIDKLYYDINTLVGAIWK